QGTREGRIAGTDIGSLGHGSGNVDGSGGYARPKYDAAMKWSRQGLNTNGRPGSGRGEAYAAARQGRELARDGCVSSTARWQGCGEAEVLSETTDGELEILPVERSGNRPDPLATSAQSDTAGDVVA